MLKSYYKTVRSNEEKDFDEKISDLIRQGWSLHGQAFRCDQFNGIAQTLTKLK
jgi:hypothetical protein